MGERNGNHKMSTWFRLYAGDHNHVSRPLYGTRASFSGDIARSIEFSRGVRIEDWPDNARYWAGDAEHDGEPEDFLLEIHGLPVISERLKDALERFGHTMHQYLPVGVFHADGTAAGRYFIINVLDVPQVLDLVRSRYDRVEYKQNAAGRMFSDLCGLWKPVLRQQAAQGHHLFRCAEAASVLVASDDIKRIFESLGVMGATFTPIEAA